MRYASGLPPIVHRVFVKTKDCRKDVICLLQRVINEVETAETELHSVNGSKNVNSK